MFDVPIVPGIKGHQISVTVEKGVSPVNFEGQKLKQPLCLKIRGCSSVWPTTASLFRLAQLHPN